MGPFLLHFQGLSVAEGNKFAERLRESLLDSHEDVRVERVRDDPSSQDMGATLVLILGTPAVVAAVAALKAFLLRRNAAQLEIRTPEGTLVASNLESKDVPEIVRAITARMNE